MTRKKIKVIYLTCFALWSLILLFFVPITKTEAWGIDINPFYLGTFWVLSALTFVYVHLFITKQIFINLLLTLVLFYLIYPFGIWITDKIISTFPTLNQNPKLCIRAFSLRFLDIILAHVLILTLLELIKKILPRKIRILNSEHIFKNSEPNTSN